MRDPAREKQSGSGMGEIDRCKLRITEESRVWSSAMRTMAIPRRASIDSSRSRRRGDGTSVADVNGPRLIRLCRFAHS